MEKEQIKVRLTQLKKAMQKQCIAVYIVPMNDFHGSEYIGDYFKLVNYFSGFTGSAGTLVVTEEEVYLWTDGRYFLQAEQQLRGTGIVLQKMGEKDVPTIAEFAKAYFDGKEGGASAVGFDGRLVSVAFAEKLSGLTIISDKDLAGEIWDCDKACPRPAFPKEPVWILEEAYTGQTVSEKLAKIREDMEKERADYLLLTTLDDIAWLTNLRGGDIAYNPVFMANMIIGKEEASIYCNIAEKSVLTYLAEAGIRVCAYDAFYEDVHGIVEKSRVWVDSTSASCRVTELIPKNCEKITKSNPVMRRKAIKNQTEVENIRQAHIKDGVAVTKFIYWLKNCVCTGEESATEISAAIKLEEFRRQQEDYVGESFAPIIAHAEHAAVVHYNAEDGENTKIHAESFLLCDTGGHYLQGTTDITRTVAMGQLTAEQKKHYTAVLQGNLRLANAKFKHGLTGANLDYLAREPLYRLGLDFNHGTGHGVGYLLNVHEGPNAFRMRYAEDSAFEEGMVTSDEPGFYPEGQYGIRLENLIVCVKAEKTAYGQFLCFEPLTMVPFDPDAIDTEMMTEEDKRLLSAYHKKVYDCIAEKLTDEERSWLEKVTASI